MFCKVPNKFMVCTTCYQSTVWERGRMVLNPKSILKKIILKFYAVYSLLPSDTTFLIRVFLCRCESNATIKDCKALLISLPCLFLVLAMADILLVSFLRATAGCSCFSWTEYILHWVSSYSLRIMSQQFAVSAKGLQYPYLAISLPLTPSTISGILLKKVWYIRVPWRIMDEESLCLSCWVNALFS